MGSIFFALLNRTRFKYNIRMIVEYFTQCICCRSPKTFRYLKNYKNHSLFKKAETKYLNEVDIIRVVKSLRKFKMLT
jgi:hypothetical protein